MNVLEVVPLWPRKDLGKPAADAKELVFGAPKHPIRYLVPRHHTRHRTWAVRALFSFLSHHRAALCIAPNRALCQ